MPELATPEEVLEKWASMEQVVISLQHAVENSEEGNEALRVAFVETRAALSASQERVRELEAENVALRANTSASVVRRLVEQGALRGPTTAEAEGERGLKQEGGVQD